MKTQRKLSNLKKIVLKLQNKIEHTEFKDVNKDHDEDETLEGLIRRNSGDIPCKDCEYIATNISRFKHHMKKHIKQCEQCPWRRDGTKTAYYGKEEWERHVELVHTSSEIPLPEDEAEILEFIEIDDIVNGPKTPRSKSVLKHHSRRVSERISKSYNLI